MIQVAAPKDLASMMQKETGSGLFGAGIFGEPYVRILSVSDNGPGALAGLQTGDTVLELGGEPVRVSSELINGIQASEGQTLELVVRREHEDGDQEMVLTMTPELDDGRYRIGVGIATVDLLFSNPEILKHQPYGFGEAIVAGIGSAWESTVATIQSFRKIFTGGESVRDSVGGPVMIGKITKEALDRGWEPFWFLVAMLSITLAIINILPIPALDGGHLVFLIYEGIVRREPSVRFRMAVQQIGMVMILGLMVFLIVNDILKL
jgi:regulator of sigma E protease